MPQAPSGERTSGWCSSACKRLQQRTIFHGKPTTRLHYAYIGSQYTNLLYSPETDRLASRGILSAQLTWEQEGWRVEAFGTNLTDKTYVSGQFGNNEFYGAPREYGLRVAKQF